MQIVHLWIQKGEIVLQYYIVIFCILIAWLAKLKEKNIYNPLTGFFLFWSIIIGLASLCLFDLYETSQHTYIVISVGLFSYLIGYLMIKTVFFPIKKITINSYNTLEKYRLRYNFLYIVYFITLIYMLYRSFDVLLLLLKGNSLSNLRGSFGTTVLGSSWEIMYENYVNEPLLLIMIPLGIIDFFVGRKDKRLLYLSILLATLSSVTSGGRFIFYYIFVHFIFASLIFKKRTKISKKIKRTIFITIIVGISAIYVVTVMRGASASITKQIYIYLSGCIPHLDYRLKLIDASQVYTNGWTFMSGYLKPFFQLIKNIGLLDYPKGYADSLVLSNVDNFVNIGKGTIYNAFVTPFFYFYLDGGLIGVAICSLIYGGICAYSYCLVKYRPNLKNISIYLILIQGIFTTMVRWQFTNSAFALSFIFLLFAFKRQKYKKN